MFRPIPSCHILPHPTTSYHILSPACRLPSSSVPGGLSLSHEIILRYYDHFWLFSQRLSTREANSYCGRNYQGTRAFIESDPGLNKVPDTTPSHMKKGDFVPNSDKKKNVVPTPGFSHRRRGCGLGGTLVADRSSDWLITYCAAISRGPFYRRMELMKANS